MREGEGGGWARERVFLTADDGLIGATRYVDQNQRRQTGLILVRPRDDNDEDEDHDDSLAHGIRSRRTLVVDSRDADDES